MKPTGDRKRMMHHGDVFSGIKTKNAEKRKAIEAQRHNKFMDMISNEALVEAGLSRPRPDHWVENYIKMHGIERTGIKLKDQIKEISAPELLSDEQCRLYFESDVGKKNLRFYQQALSYWKNKYS